MLPPALWGGLAILLGSVVSYFPFPPCRLLEIKLRLEATPRRLESCKQDRTQFQTSMTATTGDAPSNDCISAPCTEGLWFTLSSRMRFSTLNSLGQTTKFVPDQDTVHY